MTVTAPETPRHPVFARLWSLAARQLDKQGGAEQRRHLLSGLHGRVIEIGAGDGRNFAHYPKEVSEVLAVEPEGYLRAHAEEAARKAPVEVSVLEGVAERLPADDDSFEAAVVSLVLCSVDDLAAALGEIRRVLRPGGRLRFFEHVVAHGGAHRRLQHALDATIWPRVNGGCHTARDTLTAIRTAGLSLSEVDRFRFPGGRMPLPTSPHVRGEAIVA